MHDDGLLDLDNQFCFALYAASRRVMRSYTEALKELDLTYPQYLVLLVLWEWATERLPIKNTDIASVVSLCWHRDCIAPF